MSYEDMRSGDLIVFSMTGGFSDVISMVTDSPYTHVGIVLLIKVPGGDRKRVCILESTNVTDTPDALSLQQQEGVAVRELQPIVDSAKASGNNSVWWGQRTTPFTQEEEDKLTLFALGLQGRPYDYLQAIASPFDAIDDILTMGQDPCSKLFCSELVVVCELAVTGMVYHKNHKAPINASAVVPREVVELHVAGVPIWKPLIKL